MRVSGIVRRIDDLGRVVIPREIRRSLRIKEGDPLEIFFDSEGVLFKKYNPCISVKRALNDLKEAIQDEDGLEHRQDLLRKLSEFDSILNLGNTNPDNVSQILW